MGQSTSPWTSDAEAPTGPVKVIVWVLAGCVVFVVAGIWLTQPRSAANEGDELRYRGEELTEEEAWRRAWKHVWTPESSGTAEAGSGKDETIDRLTRRGASNVEAKTPKDDSAKDETTPDAGESRSESRESGPLASQGGSTGSDGSRDTEDPEGAADEVLVSGSVSSSAKQSVTEAPEAETGRVTASVASPSIASYEDPMILPQAVETRVVTLRLAGNLGQGRLDPKDGYTWGRLGYFFQRELSPPYFLVFPGGGIPGVVPPPTTSGGQVSPGRRSTQSTEKKQSLPSLRPRGALGSPIFVIDLVATLESAGTMTFYGRGLAQKYVCRLKAQIHYLGGDQPSVIDSFSVTENFAALQGRVAAGPAGRPAYQAAIEKLIKRLRFSTYFR